MDMKTISSLFIISLFINGVMTDKSVSVMEGDSVTLHTHLTEIQRDYLIDWRFGDQQVRIAKINGGASLPKIYDDVLDGRFRDRLRLNSQTGDLTITNIATQHTGDYTLDISNRDMTTKTFNINVSDDKVKTVMVGDSGILVNNVIKKPRDEKMMWRIRHNKSPVAEMNGTGLVLDGRFRNRLQVDDQTGDLTITNITPDDSGSYEVDITVGSHIYTIHRSFSVNVKDRSSGLSSGVTALICVAVLGVVAVAVAVGFMNRKKMCRTPGNELEHVGSPKNDEETEGEMAEMNKPLRDGRPSSSDVP